MSIVLDMLIKIVLVAYAGVLITLSAAPIAGFVFLAVVLSIFHFVCLFLGCTFALMFELVRLTLPFGARSTVALIVANTLFVAGFAAFFSLSLVSDNIGSIIWSNLVVGLCLAATNLLSILIVAVFGYVFRRVRLAR